MTAIDQAWGASWVWGLSLIAATIAWHALSIALMVRGMLYTADRGGRAMALRYPIAVQATLVGLVGLLLAVLHGLEAAVWAAAYMWVGALDSWRDALFCSLDSLTTRGASGLELTAAWRMMGALEAADGMLLFGISTAFVFAVIQEVTSAPSDPGKHPAQPGG